MSDGILSFRFILVSILISGNIKSKQRRRERERERERESESMREHDTEA